VKLSFLKRVKKPKASIAIDLPKGPFALGEKVNGTITVESEEEVDLNEVVFKLVCIESKKKIKKEKQKGQNSFFILAEFSGRDSTGST